MAQEQDNKIKQIDLTAIVKLMLKYKKAYLIGLPATFIIACLYIVCIPRYYNSSTMLAPELSSFSGGSLGDIASSFGIDLGNTQQGADAILPDLYPDLMNSNSFICRLSNVRVKTIDNKINTTYYDYIATKQEKPFWSGFISLLRKPFETKDKFPAPKGNKLNPQWLNREQTAVIDAIRSSLSCNIDKKTYAITIAVEAQDPLICATIADTVRSLLQQSITQYRTKKARNDYEYYKKLCSEAKSKYERARQTYGSYADANTDIILPSFKSKEEDLENEMQLLYNTYSTMATQMQQAQAK